MPTVLRPQALTGFTNAPSYDTHRPTYPQPSTDLFLQHLRLSNKPGAKIVDLGAGTGKFTEALVAREEGYEIIAVEPHPEMRGELEMKRAMLGGNWEKVAVKDGGATEIPVERGSVDAVVVGQAFHWFANEGALREIHRVLRPGGMLGLIWNIEDYNAPKSWQPTTAWERTVKAITWSLDSEKDSDPRFRHEKWAAVFENQGQNGQKQIFNSPMGQHSDKYKRRLSKQAIWERYHTLSQVANLKGDELESVCHQVFNALENDKEATDDKDEVELNWATYFVWMEAI
ncbi:hypothetical protein AJ79_00161 [Helicocarpus griseus UAMH5409]|uniref:Methyltransferase type 11 domain-containing protein n=1 Tax=Helicocarpus griseus UAMH5409 TaxID=1447875 RepID=A0A2B7YCW2_9EURO|nr:hypothetical protein AJ79_00161 [Helicocarpus griseus UAMH5409]